MATDLVKAGNINFSNAVEAARLQLEAVEALGNYKLAISQAELVSAHARNEHAKAAAREVVVHQLRKTLAQLNKQKAAIRRQIRIWEKAAQRIALVQDGDRIVRPALTQMWQAFTLYQRLATAEINHQIEDVAITQDERRRDLYSAITALGKEPLDDDIPDDIDNLGALIAWLQEEGNVMPKKGRRPHQLVRDAFLILAGTRAASEIDSLHALMSSIEKGTLDPWKPILIAPFLDNSAISRLVDVKP